MKSIIRKNFFAWNPKSSTDNERNTIVIKNDKITILCRQIAGALAKKLLLCQIQEYCKSLRGA